MNLPLPEIRTVKECYQQYPGSVTLIIEAHEGQKNRYNVIRIVYATGEATTIGRELPLDLAERVARRPAAEDGEPLRP